MHPPTHVYPDPLVLRAFFVPVFGILQNFVRSLLQTSN